MSVSETTKTKAQALILKLSKENKELFAEKEELTKQLSEVVQERDNLIIEQREKFSDYDTLNHNNVIKIKELEAQLKEKDAEIKKLKASSKKTVKNSDSSDDFADFLDKMEKETAERTSAVSAKTEEEKATDGTSSCNVEEDVMRIAKGIAEAVGAITGVNPADMPIVNVTEISEDSLLKTLAEFFVK